MLDAKDSISSTRPYLIRALYEWCVENGYTPFLAVAVDASVRVPFEFVKDGEIVLNISADATSALHLGNDAIEFKGRFGGVARDICVPVERVLAIYARENGQGMAFPIVAASSGSAMSEEAPHPAGFKPNVVSSVHPAAQEDGGNGKPQKPSGRSKPVLTRIK